MKMKTAPRLNRALAASCLALASLSAPSLAPAFAQQNQSVEEKALEQTLSSEQAIGQGRTEIAQGHVDMGPKFVDGQWKLMYHDDHEAAPVWRSLSDVVLKGGDGAKMPMPDDERYSFVQANPGDEVYVIPQTEMAGVVWPGWNTQDPEVVSKLGRGVSLRLDKVEGPGGFSLYLENGNFSAPQVLWTSDKSESQEIWVEPNSHTHANWVFTQPGIYFLTVTASAELADGSTVTDTERMQFAVGSEVTSEQVFAAAATAQAEESESTSQQAGKESASSAASEDSTQQPQDAAASSSSALSPLVWVGLVALLLLAGSGIFALVSRKNKQAQQQARDMLK